MFLLLVSNIYIFQGFFLSFDRTGGGVSARQDSNQVTWNAANTEKSTQYWFKVGPLSESLAQH